MKQKVSIPFKRESLSKAVELAVLQAVLYVSIPFKRESLSKVFPRETLAVAEYVYRFHSLQTGKSIQR